MASRVRVAASACLVASGLLIGGAGGAMALADPEHGNAQTDDTNRDDSVGGIVRRAFSLDGTDGEKASEPSQRPQTRAGNGRDGQDATGTGSTPTVGAPMQDSPQESATDSTTRSTKTSEPPKSTETTTPCPDRTTNGNPPPGQRPPNPPASSGGGGGGAVVQLPRFTPPQVPGMQLPQELTPKQPGLPGGPSVLDAGAGAAAGAPVGPAAPIALPAIVAPPVGLGAGAGGAGSGAAAGVPPTLARAVPAEPPAGRIPSPANAGSNVAVPNPSYRLGYTQYLRSAALPQVAALAVPGLVGILVLTGAGGLVGYRQAKAGHAVRVGSSARFMR